MLDLTNPAPKPLVGLLCVPSVHLLLLVKFGLFGSFNLRYTLEILQMLLRGRIFCRILYAPRCFAVIVEHYVNR